MDDIRLVDAGDVAAAARVLEPAVGSRERASTVAASSTMLGAFRGPEIVAAVAFTVDGAELTIRAIAALPTSARRGFGRRLIDAVREQFPTATIVAETDLDAVEFYRRYGFRIRSLGDKYPGVERFVCTLDPAMALE